MAGRPPKSHLQLVSEGKSHRTKAELEHRKKAEESLLTKVRIKEFPEVKNNPEAHKEFTRVKRLLEKIDKNDDLFASVLNRYAMIYAECKDFETKREEFYKTLSELEGKYQEDIDHEEIPVLEYLKMRTSIQAQVIALDKQVQNKRKMLLDIEKENLMTIASALRSIPKTPVEKNENEELSLADQLFGSL